MSNNKSTDSNETKPSISIELPDDLIIKSETLVIHHIDNTDALNHAINMGHNIIVLDEGEGMIPSEKSFMPDMKDSHHDLLKLLIEMGESSSTVLAYFDESTLEFFLSYDSNHNKTL
jgi:hypothetical protein